MGKDTTIRGATLRGDEVVGRVGGDLTVASAADTGKVKGKESDLSVTLGSGLSGSLGYGKTTGQTNWVQEQTSIGAKDRLDIRTENHTQLDGAVLASDSGNLKLDTGTLGYSDIAGKDKEHGYYLNVGGSVGLAGGGATQDPSQVGKGKEGENNWSVSGWDYQKDREQIVRATVGTGEVVVRDAPAGKDATAGLNRDVDKAYDITRDEESRTDLYVSSSSLEAVADPVATAQEWTRQLLSYNQTAQKNFEQATQGFNAAVNRIERVLGRKLPEGALFASNTAMAEATMEALILGGMTPSQAMMKMSQPQFQEDILKALSSLLGVEADELEKTQSKVKSEGDPTGVAFLLEATVIEASATEKITQAQELLRGFARMQQYLAEFPDEKAALSVILTLAQGPKGMLQVLVQNAAAGTEVGQYIEQKITAVQAELGKSLAAYIENRKLDSDIADDVFVIGGGDLMVEILTGSIPGGRREVGRTNVSVEKGSAIPIQAPTTASNGLVYKSNPKHTLGQMGNRKNAGLEPRNSLELFENSIASSIAYGNKQVRYAVDKDGAIHRFEGTNGEFHWNGSSGDANNPLAASQIPTDVQKKLGVKLK